jgi:hypothetical protein
MEEGLVKYEIREMRRNFPIFSPFFSSPPHLSPLFSEGKFEESYRKVLTNKNGVKADQREDSEEFQSQV